MLVLAWLLQGCSRTPEFAGPAPAMQAKAAYSAERHLAYEHSITLDVPEARVPAVSAAAQAACTRLGSACEMLESQLETGSHPSAALKFRASPEGVRTLTQALSREGEVTGQATKAEDLAVPMADAAKRLAMLADYRTKLEGLQARAANDVDALIKVQHELATVQSELEAATAAQARLAKRVQTEVLDVSIQSQDHRSWWAPINRATRSFGSSLSEGISITITGLAYLLPWALVFGGLFWGFRRLRARVRRRSRPGQEERA